MLAAIIPKTCLVDLAKKVHNLRIKWDIPQFCHQQDEIKGLYAQDDGFLGLQVITFLKARLFVHFGSVRL